MPDTLKSLEDKLKSVDTEKQKIDILLDMCEMLAGSDAKKVLKLGQKAYGISKNVNYKLGIAQSLTVIGSSLNKLADYKSALDNLFSGLEMSRSLGERRLEASILINIGTVYIRLSEHSLALENYLKSLEIFRDLKDKKGEALSLNNIGTVHKGLGNYRVALEYFLESLNKKEEAGYLEAMHDSLSNIGIIYSLIGEYEKAIEYSKKALELMVKYNDRQKQPIALSNIGFYYKELGDKEEAMVNCLKALEICRETGNRRMEVATLSCIGEIYSDINKYNEAKKYYTECYKIAEEIGDSPGVVLCFLALGNIYLKIEEYEKALSFLDRGLEMAKSKDLPGRVKDFHKFLSDYYETMGDYFNAMKHFKIFYELEKEDLVRESELKTKGLIIQYEADKHQKEAQLIRTKNEELTRVINKLDRINDEKNNFIGIVSHDLRDPLSSIYSVADLILSDLDDFTQEELLDFIGDIKVSSDKVIMLLQRLLDINAIETGKLALKFENTDVNEEILSLLDRYVPKAEAKDIDIRYSQPGPAFAYSDKSSIEQIFSNLISNSIKYSPPGKNIYIHVSEFADYIRFEIEDEGPGFTEKDKKSLFEKFARLSARPTSGEKSVGLGLSIVKKLVEMNQGNIVCESEEGKGAKFIVELPKTKIE